MDRHRRRPLYSADNEDSRSELAALEITGSDGVVAICAGGGRALSLLAAGPGRLLAIDRRADQLFQLELKAAALEALPYEAFLAFLGIGEGADRLGCYAELRPALSPSARRYWDRRPALLREGVFHAGRTERALMGFMRALGAGGRMDWLDALFRAADLQAQRTLLARQRGQVERWLRIWRHLLHPLVIYPIAQDPGFLRSTGGSLGVLLVQRILDHAQRNLVRQSMLLRLVVDGGLGPSSPLPPYLTRSGFERAQKNLARLELQCTDLHDFVVRCRPAATLKWSLSDVSGWMSEASFHEILRSIARRSPPGTRFCARNFAAHRGIPRDLRGRVRRLDALCQRLDREDSSAIYRFEVGEVVEGPQPQAPPRGSPRRPGAAA